MPLLNANAMKSVHNFIAEINTSATGDSYVPSTIPSVDSANSIVLPRSIRGSNSSDPYGCGSLRLVSNTSVRTQYFKHGSGTLVASIFGVVIEFYPGLIRSIQYVQGGSSPRTISSVNTNKSIVLSTAWGGYTNRGVYNAALQSGTSVIVPTQTGSNSLYWIVLEFI